MKKFLRRIIHNRKKIFKTLVIVGLAVVSFVVAHKLGNAERGYNAIGGEIFVPLLVIFGVKIREFIKLPLEALNEN